MDGALVASVPVKQIVIPAWTVSSTAISPTYAVKIATDAVASTITAEFTGLITTCTVYNVLFRDMKTGNTAVTKQYFKSIVPPNQTFSLSNL